ncbi:indolethylamine N-methyltransferase-like [Hyperolius riggenbachi]|uniref:indolethylamine N-methyltransferase-like n=1 Tax=Hyperolius riggenbachi TaxID=752182 RepID=UPI0035A330A8
MDCAPNKIYHKHDFDSRAHLETYCSEKSGNAFSDDAMKFPMMNFHHMFSSGFVKGDVLVDLSMGSLIHHLYSASNVFKDIIILKLNEKCNMETSRWKEAHTGAFNWKHISAIATTLDRKSSEILDMTLKSAIKHIIPCDFENENITHPVVLPLADCITSLWLIDIMSKDGDDYTRNLEKISKRLRPGGHLILVAALDMSYFMVGTERMHAFKCDEGFVKNSLQNLGFVIEYCAVQRRKTQNTLTDYKAMIFITACKTK